VKVVGVPSPNLQIVFGVLAAVLGLIGIVLASLQLRKMYGRESVENLELPAITSDQEDSSL
jgi:glucose uptake protein GlcU